MSCKICDEVSLVEKFNKMREEGMGARRIWKVLRYDGIGQHTAADHLHHDTNKVAARQNLNHYYNGCAICDSPEATNTFATLRAKGWGADRIWGQLASNNSEISRNTVRRHAEESQHDRDVGTALGEFEDKAEEVTLDWFQRNGIEIPPGFIGGTIEVDVEGRKHWLRVRPEAGEQAEIRQATPVNIVGPRPSPIVIRKGKWSTWMTTPDAQIGYWMAQNQTWYTTHDERAVDITHQIGWAVADAEGLDGWLDLGDYLDLPALSTHRVGVGDLSVHALNKAVQRGSDIMATRRSLVGEKGRLKVLGGNHDIRLPRMTAERMPYLVGLRRADDPEDEHPVLSVPYLCRFREHGVEWTNSFPGKFTYLNSNLVAMHACEYGSRPFATAQKISSRIHASVIYGHVHRRETMAKNIETDKGTRTLELWSDGTLARTDSSIPSMKATYNERDERETPDSLEYDEGLLSENWQQGFSIVYVEKDRGLFSRIPGVIWGDWCNFLGTEYRATVDVNGAPV